MVFSSPIFLFYFLPLVLAVYYLLPGRGRHLWLCLCSYAFYGWANPAFMGLMLFSTAVDYFCGLTIANAPWRGKTPIEPLAKGTPRSRRQKIALAISIVTNLSLLGFFKYFNLAAESFDAIAAALGGDASIGTVLRVTLPLGISFYTFQSMSYSIDIYRGDAQGMRHPLDFACYVSLFPQLVAGPIIRYQEVADQLQARSHTTLKFSRGIAFLALGMAKKVMLANPCGKVADLAFATDGIGVLDAWWGVVAYSFQIYFDFSGYSDMAIGLGLMFGFVFPKNFDSPYHSKSITEFWRRWHLSLSTWLRDYLYIPLGGNRKGNVRTYVNLAAVMLLGGLWHGAAWTFLIWGAIHGFMLGFERFQGKDSPYRRLPGFARMGITYVIVLITWVFFRADSLDHALTYVGALFGVSPTRPEAALLGGIIYQPWYIIHGLIAAAVVWGAPQTWDFTRRIGWPKAAWILLCGILAVILMITQSFNPFIYFIF